RQQRRLRIFLLEVFEDRERLHQRRAVAIEQGRHDHFRIERPVGGVELVTLEQIQRDRFSDQPLQAPCDPLAKRGLSSPIGVKPHAMRPPMLCGADAPVTALLSSPANLLSNGSSCGGYPRWQLELRKMDRYGP